MYALGRTKEIYNISAPQERPHGGNTDTERTISFSDAVIAIAITLLALDLNVPHVPESSAAAELQDMGFTCEGFFGPGYSCCEAERAIFCCGPEAPVGQCGSSVSGCVPLVSGQR